MFVSLYPSSEIMFTLIFISPDLRNEIVCTRNTQLRLHLNYFHATFHLQTQLEFQSRLMRGKTIKLILRKHIKAHSTRIPKYPVKDNGLRFIPIVSTMANPRGGGGFNGQLQTQNVLCYVLLPFRIGL